MLNDRAQIRLKLLVEQYIADGQPQATEFPTFEQLNMGQDARYKLGRPAPLDVNKNYQQLRENFL